MRARMAGLALLASVVAPPPALAEPERVIAPAELRSGSAFQSATTRAEQEDLGENPGMLWVEQGEKLWKETAGASAMSCASCHGEIGVMKGVATRFPQVETASGRLVNLADRIRECRSSRQGAPELPFESEALLALTAAVTFQSRGEPLRVASGGAAAAHLEAGRTLYYRRQGQLNLSCANCHEQNWGKRARNETISQGHPNGFPSYRLEWQTFGSLERRLKACFLGVRAEPLPDDGAELRELELFLAWRALGLAVEAPSVRR